jgi:hypothetical protein
MAIIHLFILLGLVSNSYAFKSFVFIYGTNKISDDIYQGCLSASDCGLQNVVGNRVSTEVETILKSESDVVTHVILAGSKFNAASSTLPALFPAVSFLLLDSIDFEGTAANLQVAQYSAIETGYIAGTLDRFSLTIQARSQE